MSPRTHLFQITQLLIALSLGCCDVHAADSPKSVYQINPAIDWTIIGVTSIGSLIPITLRTHLISPHCPCDPGQVNGIDRSTIGNDSKTAGTISDVTVGLALAGPPLLDYLDIGASRALAEDFTVYAQVLSVSGALVVLSQFTVQRPIPLVYSGDRSPLDPNGYTSFYSGHTSMTFAALSAAATTVTLRYNTGVWPWLIVGAVGGSVAYERVAAGQHFPTDVLMGSVAGIAAGTLIPILHKKHPEPFPVSVSSTPQSISVAWTHPFL